MENNKGHDNLINDLDGLLKEAISFAFHDFKNEKYDTPKVALRERLLKLAENVVDGKYDN